MSIEAERCFFCSKKLGGVIGEGLILFAEDFLEDLILAFAEDFCIGEIFFFGEDLDADEELFFFSKIHFDLSKFKIYPFAHISHISKSGQFLQK